MLGNSLNHTAPIPFFKTLSFRLGSFIPLRIKKTLDFLFRIKRNVFYSSPRSRVKRYFVALLVIGISGIIALNFAVLGDTRILLLFSGVIFSSWYGGLGAGLFAAILAILVDYQLSLTSQVNFGYTYTFRLFIFTLISLFISYLVSSKQKYEQMLYNQALHDHLTGLPNRRLVEETLDFALNRAKRNHEGVGVMFLDLDKFKCINDELGHDIGDEVLRNVGLRLSTCIRKEDCVGRLGGDEFVVIIVDVKSKDDVKRVAEKIISTFYKEFFIKDNSIITSTSIGVAMYPFDGDSVEVLMKHADEALYVVKNLSRNNFLLYDEMSKQTTNQSVT